MRTFRTKITKGTKISFKYDAPKTGPAERTGTLEHIKRAKKTLEKLILFTITEDDGKIRSFHYNKMHNIRVF